MADKVKGNSEEARSISDEMNWDYRYKTIPVLIESGHITSFKDIFDYIPKTVVASPVAKPGRVVSKTTCLLPSGRVASTALRCCL